MSDRNAASPNGKPTPAVIRRMDAAEETSQERLFKKHVPAWVVSGAIHVVVIALMILILGGRVAETKPSEKVLSTTAQKTEDEPDPNLTNEDAGLDSRIEAAMPQIEKIDKLTVDDVVTKDPVGQPDKPDTNTTALEPPGPLADFSTPGIEGKTGNFRKGDGGKNGQFSAAFNGRSGATKSRLVAEGGGNGESEQAVAWGLAWLAKQQKSDGSWEYDAEVLEDRKADYRLAATGMALLPFLAAGETHKASKNSPEHKYKNTVDRGLKFLMGACPLAGQNQGRMAGNMYAQAIATLPLCEAYGMTKDPVLKAYAQAAINYIQYAQANNGSWGYAAKAMGDTSIVGWQIQALQAAKLTKDITVDDRVINEAIKFLNSAAGGAKKSMYGYRDSKGASPGTARTAVGLLCRYYIDNWGPSHPGMTEGVEGLVKLPPRPVQGNTTLSNMYYYYYATQVVHFFEGESWKNWNEGPKGPDGVRKGGMRDWLVGTQVRQEGANRGSWEPEKGEFGNNCGRLGTTAVALLTLEVYYRHLPLYKRGADGNAIRILEDK